MTFNLHPDLQRDCFTAAALPLCEVLLRNDARFPWIILVPRREGLKEWFDLSASDMDQCSSEVMHTASVLKRELQADKINIAALGNITPQLHIHIIARFINDIAWPNPVWNTGNSIPYGDHERHILLQRINNITKM